jgi:catecholate siderophore receptor
MRFEHDLSDTTTIRNTTRWSRVKQDYLMTAVMGGASNITQPDPNDVAPGPGRVWRTPKISNKILTNQTNLTSTFYTGSIGHDVSAGVELTRETQTNYGVYPLTPPAVNIYHPNSDLHRRSEPQRRQRQRTDGYLRRLCFRYPADYPDFELNGGIRLDNYQTKYDSASLCGGTGRGAIACPTGVAKNARHHVDTSTSGNLVNWKAGALYHLTDNGNLYVNYAISQQPPGGSNFTLAQSGTGSSANRTDFKPQKAKTSEVGTKWELMDKRLLLTAALFRTDIENEVEQNDDGTYSQYGKKRVEGYELSLAGNITPTGRLLAAIPNSTPAFVKARTPPRMAPARCRIRQSTPLPSGASIRQPMRSPSAQARDTSAACIAAATARSVRLPTPKATGWLMRKWAIALTVISICS